MELLGARTVVDYLVGRGVVGPAATAVELGGGVSNVVLAISDGSRRLVLKQALPRLRVAEEWSAPPTRTNAEAAALRLAETVIPERTPRVVDTDPDDGTLVIERAPDSWRDWRERLLQGDVDAVVAATLGRTLAAWHTATAEGSVGASVPTDPETFDALRLAPYHRAAAARAPEFADELLAAADALAASSTCLAHGDFSPKNVLVGPRSGDVLVIDFEVVHRGAPVFDVAFLVTHLVLKSIHRPLARDALARAGVAFLDAYRAGAGPLTSSWEDTARHIACLLVSRVHGKSPAEYLDGTGRDRALGVARSLLRGEVDDVGVLIDPREAA